MTGVVVRAAAAAPDSDRRTQAQAQGRSAGAWGRPLPFHVAAFALLLLLLAPLMVLESGFVTDEGAYATQVHALERGSWAFVTPATAAGPAGRWFPLVDSPSGPRGTFPYVAHPAYPLLLSGPARLLGDGLGLHLVPLFGALLTALAAWKLAEEMAPGRERTAFWLAAGSPVLFNSTILWAHSLSAGLSGMALWAALRALRRGLTARGAGVLAACVALGVLVRSEGLLFAAALAAAVGVAAVIRSGWMAGARLALAAGVPGVVAAVVEVKWIVRITGGVSTFGGVRDTTGGSSSLVASRLSGVWHELLDPGLGGRGAVVVGSVALVLLVAAAVQARFGGPGAGVQVAVLVVAAAVVLALRLALDPREPVTGIALAWPTVVWMVAGWRRRSGPMATMVAASVIGLFLLAVVATQYSTGGGLEWGWRFASPALAPLAVLAAMGIGNLVAQRSGSDRRLVAAAIAGSIALSCIGGLVVLRTVRVHTSALVSDVVASRPEVVVSTDAPWGRLAWPTEGRTDWLLVPSAEVPDALARLRSAGFSRVVVLGRAPSIAGGTTLGGFTRVDDPVPSGLRRSGYDLVVLRL